VSERLIRLDTKDVEAFAEASGDRNPQYVDEVFARRTPFGRPILQGALTVIAALAAVDGGCLRSAGRLDARFSGPMVAGATYRVVVASKEDGVTSVVARDGDLTVLAIELSPGVPLAGAVQPEAVELPVIPDAVDLSERGRGEQFTGSYAVVSPAGLRELADRLGATEVPDALLGAVAWCSRFVGMQLPGRDALFSSFRVSATSAQPDSVAEPRYVATLRAADTRTGTVRIGVECTGAGDRLEAELRAFQRAQVPTPDWSSATRLLPRSDRLAGSTVLVVGGSRGIGAAIVSVLVAQGATVLATQRTAGPVEALQREFGADRVRPVLLDATDADSVRSAYAVLAAEGIRLDGLVLCAGPAVPLSTIHPDTVDSIRDFVDTSLASALLPLSGALALLTPGSWLAVMSSGAVEDVPEQRPQYYIAKSAVEALGRYCAHQHGLRVLLARAPKMWTEMSNGPLGRMGTVPTERVASAIVDWVLNPVAGDDPVTVFSSAELKSYA
jgi:NAD(P)-dependent dehydrogenase (short-subunit alcohol dehydrogenase family)